VGEAFEARVIEPANRSYRLPLAAYVPSERARVDCGATDLFRYLQLVSPNRKRSQGACAGFGERLPKMCDGDSIMVQFGWRDETLGRGTCALSKNCRPEHLSTRRMFQAWMRGLKVSAIAVVLARVLALASLPARDRVEHEVTEQRRVSVGHVP
jgi:hypothetical protein